MRKLFNDIHFSIHSVLVQWLPSRRIDLKRSFYHWICCGTAELEGDWGYNDYRVINWLESPVSKTDFPDGIEWDDILDYANGLSLKRKSLSQTENDEYKILRMETAEALFDRFLHEGLNDEQKSIIEDTWNKLYNDFSEVDYEHFDYTLKGFSGSYNGKPFILHEQQKKGIAFLCTKGNGLLAYDVGVGKTATGIASVVYQLQHDKCKRPLIIVPKAVYSKWIYDVKELFPDIQLNELKNLNKEVIDKLRMNAVFSDDNEGLLLPKNSISICTAEGAEKIFFTERSFSFLKESFNYIIPDKSKAVFLLPSDPKDKEQYVYAEELGIDLLLVDEAHRYKNLIRKVSGCRNSEFTKLGFGEPSARSVKMFALTEYIHNVSNGSNVFFLSATPFTNSPMEIYSMLLFLGGEELRDIGYENVNDFLNEFAEIKIEWSINNKNQVVRKIVMKNFRSLDALQHLIRHYIDKVDAEDAKINRPEKETHVVKIEMTDLQQQIYNYEIQHISHTNMLGVIFEGMNAMRMLMISPTLVNLKAGGIKIPNISEFVTSSPKLLLVCEVVIQIYQDRPECGQIIYLPRGVKESVLIKQYLVKNGIPESAVGMINSSTTESRKLKITDEFNRPDGKLKILIGSETISEGVDLNGNSLVLYNCMLGWNPTEPIQVEGRLWRQGNRQKKVHIVYPLMYNSLDSLIYQKHDEKASRIDAIWSYRGDKINVEEINPEELKFDLIKSPEMKAEIIMEKEAVPIRRKLKIIEESRSLISQADERKKDLLKEISGIEMEIEQLKEDVQKSIQRNKNMPDFFNWFSDTLFQAAFEEQKKLEKAIETKKKSIARIESNIAKKIEKAYGKEEKPLNTKDEFMAQMDNQEASLKKELNLIYGKKDKLISLYTAQYAAEEKAKIHSVQAATKQLVADILKND